MITIGTLQRNVKLVENFAQSQTKAATATLKTVSALERQMRALEKNARLLMGNNIEVRLTKPVDNVNKKLKQTNNELDKIKNKVPKLFSGLNLSNLFAGYYLLSRVMSAITSITDVADTATSAKARIGLYNTSQYTNDELYNMAYSAAQRSRTGITDTTDLMNRILVSGALTGPGAATQSVKLAEIINKATVAGGGTRDEIQRSLRQLAQGISSGALQGDELRSIREQTPFLAQMLAEGLNKVAPELGGNLAIGDLKELGAQGEVTSARIIEAFTAMEDEITEKFNQMPRTFSQSMTQINNVWTKFIENLSKGGRGLDRINQLAAKFADYLMSEKGQKVLSKIATYIDNALTILGDFLEGAGTIMAWLLENTYLLEGAFAALGIVLASSVIGNLAKFMTVLPYTKELAIAMLAVAAATTLVSAGLQLAGMSAEETDAAINATMATLPQSIMMVLEVLANGIIGILFGIVSIITYILELIGNAISTAFFAVLTGIVKIVEGIASLIDSVFKTNLSDSVSSAADYLWNGVKVGGKTLGELGDILLTTKEPSNNTITGKIMNTRKDLEMDYWTNKSEQDWEAKYYGQLDMQRELKDLQDKIDKFGTGDYEVTVGEVKQPVEISSEDLKLLKDIASRDMLLNMAAITPQANVTFGDVRETADVNKIMDVIEDMVENAFATNLVSY